MAFDGLREQLSEQWADLSSKVQESPTYNNLREQFESQTPPVQKAIIGGVLTLVALFLLYIPMSYMNQSSEYLTYFEENQELINGLLKSARSAKSQAPLPPPLSEDMLRSRVDVLLRGQRLTPDQIGQIQPMPQPAAKGLISNAIEQTGVAVQLRKLNLRQIIQLANQVQNMGNGIKLMGLDVVQSSGQTHYYDMIVKVVSFGLQPVASAEDAPPERGSRRSAPRPPADEED